MVKEELVAGLRNAVERGQSLQDAVQTLLLSGYDPVEVREAASHINQGVIGKITLTAQQAKQEEPTYKPLPQITAAGTETPKKKKKTWLIVLLVVVFLVVLGLIGIMVFGQSILDAIKG